MATKYNLITGVYESTINRVTETPANWTAFLRSACRNYKCRFDEQILIYAQRPDAAAVLEIEKWNSQFGRWVNKGATGIAVFDDEHNGNHRLKHYFDISDTHESGFSRPVPVWQMEQRYETDVIESLENSFGELDDKSTLADAVVSATRNVVEDNMADYLADLMNCRDGSALEEYSDDYLTSEFRFMLHRSVAYMTLTRCGIDADKYLSDFRPIINFNTPQTVNALGIAASDITESCLKEIAATVRTLEKERAAGNRVQRHAGRTFAKPETPAHNVEKQAEKQIKGGLEHDRSVDISDGGRLPAAESDRAGGRSSSPWQIRIAPKIVSETAPAHPVRESADIGQTERPPDRDRTDSHEPDGVVGTSDGGGTGRDGEVESGESNAVGRLDEQHPALSGGNDTERPDLQLKPLPTVAEQLNILGEAEEIQSSAFSMPVPMEVVDEQLIRDNGSTDIYQFRFRIYHALKELNSKDEIMKFLKREFGTGGGRSSVNDNFYINRDSKGLTFIKGNLTNSETKYTLSWKKAAKRISDLIAADRYLSENDTTELYPRYLEHLEKQAILQKKADFIDAMAKLPPAEKRDTLSERLADFVNDMRLYEKSYFSKHGLSEIADATNKAQIDELLQNPQKTEQLIAAFKSIAGATSGVYERNNAYCFGLELKELHPRHPVYHLGDTVFIGADKYEINSHDDSLVVLRDMSMPLFTREMPRDEFDRKLAENPANEYLMSAAANEQSAQPADNTPPMYAAYQKIKAENPGSMVMYQLGDFFEFYNEDAEIAAIVLDITLTSRDIRSQTERVPMCGIPSFKQDEYLKKLIDAGYSVAVAVLPDGERNRSVLRVVQTADEPAADTLTPSWEKPKPRSRTQTFDAFPGVPISERHNFVIADDDLGAGGAKTKYHNNIEAIRTLQQIEAENRIATPEEQEILSRYVGWGGVADAFDENKPTWVNEYTELKSLLTSEEYASARASTLNAHYTSPTVIKAIYKAVENMGFKTGNILEPSCGIGNFFGLVPESMSESKLFGVELDSLTGRIAQQLYQKNSIAIQGFEKTNLPDSFFDLAIGNVPFGDYGVLDKRYDKNKFHIHDYFFAKTLDKVRPGGVMAFVTSKWMMDKKNPAVRKYIAQRADLLGAIRLPNNAFLKNAGTEVTTDIIFLQKRDRIIDIEPDWVHLGQLTIDNEQLTIPVNSYFVEHPDMILGEMSNDSGVRMYGALNSTSCVPFPDSDLSELLSDAITNIHAEISDYERDEDEPEEDNAIPADPTIRNFSYTLVDGKIYYRENSLMFPQELPITTQNRVKGMVELRECVRALIEYQTENYSASDITAEQAKLNRLYDAFTHKYGLVNDRANRLAFSEDESYPLLCSLEILDENQKLKAKADMFTKRTINPYIPVTHVDTAVDALAVSIGERARVDLDFMSQLSGKDEETLIKELEGVIFLNPTHGYGGSRQDKYLTADEYLSGNVREKLEQAKAAAAVDPALEINVHALEAVQPKELTAPEISVRLGATWLPPDVIQQFIHELLDTNWRVQDKISALYVAHTTEWNVTGKSADKDNIKSYSTYGTKRVNAYHIIEQSLNLRTVRVFDTIYENGKEKQVLNKKETAIAQDKQDIIKAKFSEWIWKDPDRRERLCKMYNERFNSIRPREYDGKHIRFSGMSPEYKLDLHQVNAVARYLYGGNALFGHVVGAGKSFEMIASAMEAKRLGLCNKPMFAVPNNIIGDFTADFFKLYPSANVLMATAKDFEKKNRKKFCARIATGEYDGIIIAHSQFEKIPMSIERQTMTLERQIRDISRGIAEVKEQKGERFTIKQMERTRKALELKLERLNDQSRKDSLVTFEELGVDALFVDEADLFKNLYLITKMRNVGGISQTESQKASDLFMKTQYLDEFTGNRGVVFATGTPISNSMAEMYTMQRYLQYDTLVKHGLQHFDCWASTFGETTTAMELTPEGTGFQLKTRFSNFYNLPELMAMFKEVADIRTKDMLKLPTPKVHYRTVVTKPSEIQAEMIAGLAERAERIRKREVDATEDNMLLITNDGRKIALDQRLVNPLLPDEPESKVNACVDNVHRIWDETSDKRLTQLIFCDLSTPKGDGRRDDTPDSESPPVFTDIYNDIRRKLIAKGIPAEEIAFIHEAKNEAQRKELFAKVRAGAIRVLLGSTSKMGAGTNVQKLLIAEHNLDCPWRPRDLERAPVTAA